MSLRRRCREQAPTGVHVMLRMLPYPVAYYNIPVGRLAIHSEKCVALLVTPHFMSTPFHACHEVHCSFSPNADSIACVQSPLLLNCPLLAASASSCALKTLIAHATVLLKICASAPTSSHCLQCAVVCCSPLQCAAAPSTRVLQGLSRAYTLTVASPYPPYHFTVDLTRPITASQPAQDVTDRLPQ